MTSVKFRGKEVQNPILRILVMVTAILSVVVILPISMLFLFVIVLPIALITDPIFKLFGRVGNIRNDGRSLAIKLDGDSFKKSVR